MRSAVQRVVTDETAPHIGARLFARPALRPSGCPSVSLLRPQPALRQPAPPEACPVPSVSVSGETALSPFPAALPDSVSAIHSEKPPARARRGEGVAIPGWIGDGDASPPSEPASHASPSLHPVRLPC